MPEHSSNESPDNLPDGSTGDSSKGQPAPDPGAAPRIAPPEGARAARGEFLEFEENETGEETPLLLGAEIPTLEVDSGAIKAPDVEDSYAPLGINPGFESKSNDFSHEDRVYNASIFEDSNSEDFNSGGGARPDTPKDIELGLLAHLGELRQRLLYCALILMAGMALTWNYSAPMQTWFAEPIIKALGNKGKIISIDPTGFFSTTVQFSLVSALIITAPLLFWQVWLFIEPALTKVERRYSLIIVPFASALFFSGAGLSYMVAPLFFKFFLAFQPVGIEANWDYMQSILLLAKMLLAFGVMFQVPVVVIFLNKLGLLSRNVLIEYWRHAVVIIFVVAAIVTPTWDPVTLMVCATPPCLLYVLSIWLVKWL